MCRWPLSAAHSNEEYHSNSCSCSPAEPVRQGVGGEDEKDEEHIKGVVDQSQSSFHKIAGLWEERIQSQVLQDVKRRIWAFLPT